MSNMLHGSRDDDDQDKLSRFLAGIGDIHNDPDLLVSLVGPIGRTYLENYELSKEGEATEPALTLDDWERLQDDADAPAEGDLAERFRRATRASDVRVREICDAHARTPRPGRGRPPGRPRRP